MTYITTTKFFNTGFLSPEAPYIRAKQGLMPQNIANDCQYIERTNAPNTIPGSVCSNYSLYPLYGVPINYGELGKISDFCPCTKYVQAP